MYIDRNIVTVSGEYHGGPAVALRTFMAISSALGPSAATSIYTRDTQTVI